MLRSDLVQEHAQDLDRGLESLAGLLLVPDWHRKPDLPMILTGGMKSPRRPNPIVPRGVTTWSCGQAAENGESELRLVLPAVSPWVRMWRPRSGLRLATECVVTRRLGMCAQSGAAFLVGDLVYGLMLPGL